MKLDLMKNIYSNGMNNIVSPQPGLYTLGVIPVATNVSPLQG
jgi:hypothetical protein